MVFARVAATRVVILTLGPEKAHFTVTFVLVVAGHLAIAVLARVAIATVKELAKFAEIRRLADAFIRRGGSVHTPCVVHAGGFDTRVKSLAPIAKEPLLTLAIKRRLAGVRAFAAVLTRVAMTMVSKFTVSPIKARFAFTGIVLLFPHTALSASLAWVLKARIEFGTIRPRPSCNYTRKEVRRCSDEKANNNGQYVHTFM